MQRKNCMIYFPEDDVLFNMNDMEEAMKAVDLWTSYEDELPEFIVFQRKIGRD